MVTRDKQGNNKDNVGKDDESHRSSREDGRDIRTMVERGHNKIVALAFVEIAPILAERLAIAQYAKKNPQIRTIAPEILSYQEALQIATKDHWLTKQQQKELLTLLMNHYSMKAL